MADDAQSLSKDFSSLSDIMEQISKKFSKLTDSSGDFKKNFDDVLKSSQKQEKENANLIKQSSVLTDKISTIKDDAREIVSVFGVSAAFVGLTEAAASASRMDKDLTKLAFRMGEGKAGAKKLYETATDLELKLGASAEDAMAITSSLSKGRFIGDIKEMSKSVFSMANATGLSDQEVSHFALTMTKAAGMSQKGTQAIMASMTKIQYSIGISEEGMSAVTERVQEAAENMRACGKSSEDIKRMASNTTALAASLEKVGISAQQTTQWIEQLTDPDRIEENIGLYSQLGISISDALGGGDITEQFADGLKDMADRAKSMGPIAGAAYAKSFGMSYKQLMKATQADVSGAMEESKKALTPEESAEKALEKMDKMSDSVSAKIEKGINSVNGFIAKLGPVILVIGAIIAKIFHGALSSVAALGSVLTQGISGSIEMGAEKGRQALERQIGASAKSAKTAFEKEIDDTGAFAAFKSKAAMEQVAGQVSTGPLAKGFYKLSENISDDIGNTGEAFEGLANFGVRQAAAAFNIYKKENEADQIKIENLKKQQETIGNSNNDLNKQLEEYNNLEKTQGKLNDYQATEKKWLEMKIHANDDILTQLNDEATKIKEDGDKRSENFRKSADGAKFMAAEYKEQRKSLDNQADAIAKNTTKLNEQKDSINAELSDLNKELVNHKERGDSLEDYNNTLKKIKATEEKRKNIEKEIGDATKKEGELRDQSNITLDKENKELERAKNSTLGMHGMANNIRNGMKGVGTMFKNAGHVLKKSLGNAMQGAKAGAKSIVAGFYHPIKIVMSIKRTFSGDEGNASVETGGGGLGGILKGIGKIAGGVGIAAIVLKILQPFIEKIKGPLGDLLNTLVNDIMPAVDPLIQVLLSLSKLLIHTFVPPILKILSKVLPFLLKIVVNTLMFLLEGVKGIQAIFSKKAREDLKAMNEQRRQMNKELDNIGPALSDAADKISTSNFETAKSVEAGEDSPSVIHANGAGTLEAGAAAINNTQDTSSSESIQKSAADSSKSAAEASNKTADMTAEMKAVLNHISEMNETFNKFIKHFFGETGEFQYYPINVNDVSNNKSF